MSYRSIKRVLGETHLELKCLLLFGFSLLVLVAGSFLLYSMLTEKLVYKENRNTGRLLVDRMLFIEHWNSRTAIVPEGADEAEFAKWFTANLSKEEFSGSFIKATRDGLPVVEPLRTERRSDKSSATSNSAGATELPSPNAFEQEILTPYVRAGARDRGGIEAPDSGSPGASTTHVTEDAAPGRQSPGEPKLPEFRERIRTDLDTYEYYRPVYAEDICATCHGSNPTCWAFGAPETRIYEGDLIAIAKVTLPNGPTQTALSWNRAMLLAIAIITVFLAMLAFYATIRYVIVKPLRHLRDVSDAISHGDVSQRADIQTGDEFESLGVAFNRMLGHLVAAQDELRQVNVDLDGKVDELAQVNMRLYEMNTVKSDFLATMSHELRTPLNSIIGFSEVLGSIDLLDEKQQRYVENIQTSGRVLLEMINDILNLAKIESGKVETRLTDFHLEQVVEAQCDMARPLSEKKNIDLIVRVQRGLVPMHQDQARIQQILNNLLSNAIKFTPEGGRITVNARRGDEDDLVMQVIDTGVGIAEEDRQTIFEKFRQGRAGAVDGDAMTREYSGTGLGLSIARELCRLLGGDVSVQSELGKGSTFSVRLPWSLEEQPRLDSSLAEGLEEFSKQKLDLPRGQAEGVAAQQ